jgi:hypothetical protein
MTDYARKFFALRNRALDAHCEPIEIMVDHCTLRELRLCEEYVDFEFQLHGSAKMLVFGLQVTVHHPVISSRFIPAEAPDEMVPIPRLFCLKTMCETTGRTVYFDDDMTSKEFLPRVSSREERLRSALTHLTNEIDGMRAFEEEIIQVISQTNWNCLRDAVAKARKPLGAAP